MDANIRNVRGGSKVDAGGPIGYRLGDERHYLQPGDNVMPAEKAREILKGFHHQATDLNGKPKGKPVTNGEAWQAAGWIDVRWSEPEWESEDPFSHPARGKGK